MCETTQSFSIGGFPFRFLTGRVYTHHGTPPSTIRSFGWTYDAAAGVFWRHLGGFHLGGNSGSERT